MAQSQKSYSVKLLQGHSALRISELSSASGNRVEEELHEQKGNKHLQLGGRVLEEAAIAGCEAAGSERGEDHEREKERAPCANGSNLGP